MQTAKPGLYQVLPQPFLRAIVCFGLDRWWQSAHAGPATKSIQRPRAFKGQAHPGVGDKSVPWLSANESGSWILCTCRLQWHQLSDSVCAALTQSMNIATDFLVHLSFWSVQTSLSLLSAMLPRQGFLGCWSTWIASNNGPCACRQCASGCRPGATPMPVKTNGKYHHGTCAIQFIAYISQQTS